MYFINVKGGGSIYTATRATISSGKNWVRWVEYACQQFSDQKGLLSRHPKCIVMAPTFRNTRIALTAL